MRVTFSLFPALLGFSAICVPHAPAQNAAKTAAEVAGTVFTPDGKPAAHVEVIWIEDDYANDVHAQRFTTKTDLSGRFHFSEPPPKLGGNRSVTLLAQSPNGGIGLGHANRIKPQGVTLRLIAPATLRVGFADPLGKPIANMPVSVDYISIENGNSLRVPPDMAAKWTRKTDALGQCYFRGLPQNANVRFEVGDERFAHPEYDDQVILTADSTQTTPPIRLKPGGIITGRVTYADTAKPAANLPIGVQGTGYGNGGGHTRTNADGTYRLAHILPGTYNLSLTLKRGLEKDWTARALEKIEVKPGATLSEQNLFLVKGVTLSGRVTDKSTGKPIEGILVGVHSPAHPRSSAQINSLVTDADGRYSLQVPSGDQYVYISGILSGNYERPDKGHDLKFEDDKAYTQNFALTPRVATTYKPIKIRVVDEQGKPVPNAKVRIAEWILDMGHGSGNGIPTDAQGKFTFTNLWADSRYSVMAEAPGYGTANVRDAFYPAGKISTLPAMTLKRGTSVVAGRVVDENGEPAAKQMVTLEGRANKFQQVYSDIQGRFQFAQLVKEPVRLMILEDDYKGDKEKTVQAGDRDVILVKVVSAKTAEPDWEKKRAEQIALVGKPAPEWAVDSWLNTVGKMPETLKGKIVLIDFWAMWCGPCVASLSAVQRVHEEYAGKGVVVIGLSADDNLPKLKDFIKSKGFTYPIAMDVPDPQKQTFGATMRRYKISGIPDVAVVDSKGILRYLGSGLDGAVGVIGEILAEDK